MSETSAPISPPSPDYLTDKEIERVEKGLCLTCGHKPMDHGKIVARRWDEPNPCSKCDCYQLVEG